MNSKKTAVIYGKSFGGYASLQAAKDVVDTLRKNGKSSLLLNVDIVNPDLFKNMDSAFLSFDSKFPGLPSLIGFLDFLKINHSGNSAGKHVLTAPDYLYKLLASFNIPSVPVYETDFERLANHEFPFVLDIKTGKSFSSVLISSFDDLTETAEEFSFADNLKLFVKSEIKGTHVAVAFLNGELLGSAELVSPGKIANDKCLNSGILMPPNTRPSLLKTAETVAKLVVSRFGLDSSSVVHCIISESGDVFISDIDISPLLNKHGLFARTALAAGLTYNELIMSIQSSMLVSSLTYEVHPERLL